MNPELVRLTLKLFAVVGLAILGISLVLTHANNWQALLVILIMILVGFS